MTDKEQCLNVAGVFLTAVADSDWKELANWVTTEDRLMLEANQEAAKARLERLRDDLIEALGGGEVGETALRAIALGFLWTAAGEDDAVFFDGVPEGIEVKTPYRRVGSRVPIGEDELGNPRYVELEVTLKRQGYEWKVVLSEIEGFAQVHLPIH